MFGEVLKLLRIYNDYTSSSLASEMGISQGYISDLENGKKEPSLDVLKKYSKIFKIPVSSIVLMAENFEKTEEKKKFKDKLHGYMIKLLSGVEKHGNPEHDK